MRQTEVPSPMEQKANSFPFAFLGNAVGERGTVCPEDFYEYKGFSGSFHPISLSKEVARSIIIILSVSGRPANIDLPVAGRVPISISIS